MVNVYLKNMKKSWIAGLMGPVVVVMFVGLIGFGYPAAIGAWAAAPDRPIVAVTGDGGFAQYMAELNTE